MPVVSDHQPSALRTLAVLGRVSNLPTVWSNCLAGWWLGGAGATERLLALLAGASAVYLGGMFLNDAFDVRFDRAHRPERPIPSGAISEGRVWQWGLGLAAFGATALGLLGWGTALLTLVLLGLVLAYNAIHKQTPLAVLLVAGCRFMVYLVAGSASVGGISGLTVWGGLALGAYVVGISLIARRESVPGPRPRWPLLLLAVPMLLAWLANEAHWRERAFALSLLLTLWMLPFLHHLLRRPSGNPAFSVSGLLAGIVIVDWLAVGGGSPAQAFAFAACFGLALLGQRYVPAT